MNNRPKRDDEDGTRTALKKSLQNNFSDNKFILGITGKGLKPPHWKPLLSRTSRT